MTPATPSKALAKITSRPVKRTNGDAIRAAAEKFKRNQKSANTLRTYEAQWRLFRDWCVDNAQPDLPATSAAVLGYVTRLYEDGKSTTTLNVAIAAIRWHHEQDHQADPTLDPGVQDMLKGARRTMANEGMAERHVKPTATLGHILKLVRACEDSLTGIRNRAMILVAFGGWLRKSDLLSMSAEKIKWEPDRAVVTLGKTKTDQAAKGQVVELPRIKGKWAELCPFTALKGWLNAAEIDKGPVWRQVYKNKATDKGLHSGDYLYELVMKLAKTAGIPAAEIAPHRTFRATPITLAILSGASMPEVMGKARHKSAQTTTRYFDEMAAGQGKVSRAVYDE